MTKNSNVFKRFEEKISLTQVIVAIVINTLLICVFAKYAQTSYDFLIIEIIFFIIGMYPYYICIKKIAEIVHTKGQLVALNIIKEDLSDSFKEVESMVYSNDLKAKSVFSEIELKFFAKIDEKDVITIIVKDIEGIIIYEE